MNSTDVPEDTKGDLQPLWYNLEILSNLLYLASRSENAQQRRYLDWAAKVIEEMQQYSKLHE